MQIQKIYGIRTVNKVLNTFIFRFYNEIIKGGCNQVNILHVLSSSLETLKNVQAILSVFRDFFSVENHFLLLRNHPNPSPVFVENPDAKKCNFFEEGREE